jgi:phosphoribosylamine--glycine ligase
VPVATPTPAGGGVVWRRLAGVLSSVEVDVKVLVVGGGGREHALCAALRRSESVERLWCAPGNAGIEEVAECLPDLDTSNLEGIVVFAKKAAVDLVVVGPEAPLVAGLGDALRAEGIAVFGPDADGARLEGSKAWAKSLMVRNNIPTAGHRVFRSFEEARAHLQTVETYPVVVKADGLAGGKGVAICYAREPAAAALSESMEKRKFGEAGATVVLEEFLRGEEASVFAITDGSTILLLPTAQDHKRLLDDDQGPNTGGMGAYSPAAGVSDRTLDVVVRTILVPVLHALKREGVTFRGVLFAGLMLTRSGPKVLEWNVRFGDPETQVVLPRIRGDLAKVFLAAAEGRLDEVEGIDVDPRAAVGVVLASGGYPEGYATGRPIAGVAEAAALPDVSVFHSATRRKDGALLTAGGRVLTVTAYGSDVGQARARAYEAVAKISWDGEHHRTDIAKRATAT